MAGSGEKNSLRNKLLWTFGLLAVYRLGVHVPVPGIDADALRDFFERTAGELFGLFNMFSGGGLENMSIFALGIMPYISASIIIQLLTVVSPNLKRLQKEEGAAGRKKITQYTRYGTVLISLVQGAGLAIGMEAMNQGGELVVQQAGWTFRIVTVITLVAGTVFLMWLGEQITEKGLGNGISLIIFAGIVAALPRSIANVYRTYLDKPDPDIFIVLLIALGALATLAAIVFMERAQRRVPISYAKRMVGRKMYGGQSTHLPLRINTAGVIPPIFASSILMFPTVLGRFSKVEWIQDIAAFVGPTTVLYSVVFVGLIIFFCFFYTAIIFDPGDIAENLKKQGGFIPGIRPGQKTKEYLDRVLTRITLWGGIYISIVCILPIFLSSKGSSFAFGGTGLLIVVGVAMDFMSRLDSYRINQQYEGLMGKNARIKGRR